MAQETLKITITADNKQAVQNIQETITATTQMGDAFNKVPATSRQATNALTNLSRVAQDAPYGFIGIANNLNPLLESFQRLQVEAKDTGTSLTKLIGGALTGPAGIGVALGVVSSLIVAFGDDMSAFIDKTLNGNNAISEQAKALGQAKKAFADAYVEMYNLGQAFDQFNNGTLSKKEVLDQYNKTLGQVYGTTKDVNEAEKVYRDNTEKYIQATYLRAAADIELKKAAEEAAKAAETAKMPSTEFTPMFGQAGGFGAGATPTKALNAQREANRRDRITELDERRKFYEDVAKQLRDEADLIDKSATKTKDFGTFTLGDKEKKDPFTELTKDFEKSLNAQETLRSKNLINEQTYLDNVYKLYKDYINKLAELDTDKAKNKIDSLVPKFDKMTLEKNAKEIKDGIDKMLAGYKPQMEVPVDTAIEDAKKEYEDYLKWLTNQTKWKEKLATENIEKEQKDLEELQKSYEKFANTIANSVTGALFSMYDAMQQGESASDALSNMFSRILRQLAEMAVKAAIFAGIMSLLPAGSAAAGGKGFLGAFKSILGLASGGIATGPTLAMIGEGSESEAVLPLSKLGGMLDRTFTAGAMANGTNNSSGGVAVLRGQDLLIALNRTQKASALKGQNISLA